MSTSKREERLTTYHNNNVFRWRHLMSATEARLNRALDDAGLKPHLLTARVKSLRSFVDKGIKTGAGGEVFKYDDPEREITDLVGIRIVVAIAEDVPGLAGVVRQQVEVVEEIHRGNEDESQAPGYQSLHLVARLRKDDPAALEFPGLAGDACIEIQIRSILQDAYASFIHDLDYKAERPVSGRTRRQLGVLAAVLDLADREFARVRAEHVGDVGPGPDPEAPQPASGWDEASLDEAVQRYVGTNERDSRPWLLELKSVLLDLNLTNPAALAALGLELESGRELAIQIRQTRPWATGAQVLDALLQRTLGSDYLARRAGSLSGEDREKLRKTLSNEIDGAEGRAGST